MDKFDQLRELIFEYYDIAWQEGADNRHHDTEDGVAQNCWDRIQAVLREIQSESGPVAKVVSGYSGDPDTRNTKTIKVINLEDFHIGDLVYNHPKPPEKLSPEQIEEIGKQTSEMLANATEKEKKEFFKWEENKNED